MPAVQTTYPTDYGVGIPGMVANGETSNRISRTVKGAVLPFGAPAFDHADQHCATPTVGTLFLGVAMLDRTAPPPATLGGSAVDAYPVDYTAAIMDMGVIWVRVAVAVTADQPAYYTPAGAWTNVASGNTAAGTSRFLDSAGVNGLTRLRVRVA